MTAPNRNALWGQIVADELARTGVDAVCIAPGSRSTPLTVALAGHDEIAVYSHLDERSAAYFALGRARRGGGVTPLVSTSGTAAVNFHPAIVEASQGRVPMLVLTADRPPELRASGANQTIDQEKLYGDAVRWYVDLPEPEPTERKLRSLRTTVSRAAATATGVPAGPVHLNVPFRKPLAPTEVPDDVPADLEDLAVSGREQAFVRTTAGAPELDDRRLREVADALETPRGLLVAGPADPPGIDTDALVALAHATGFPVLADPLSGLRFGGHTRVAPVLGGYDDYLDPRVTGDWPDPDVVLRIGASPTSKTLRKYLARTGARQLIVDPAGKWREAEFTASDLVVADPSRLAGRLAGLIGGAGDGDWRERWQRAERTHWRVFEDETSFFEGGVVADAVGAAPDPATVFVSNSMPVRDLDRFGRPDTRSLTVLGNRGASGIDGIVSTALGSGSATTDPLVVVLGDLAYYHDMNGLLAVGRCGVDATVVLVNNDGGGIFHRLPIESFDPPFTGQFRTPHGLDFEPSGDLYDLEFERVGSRASLSEAVERSVATPGTRVIEARTEAVESHGVRDRLHERVVERLSD